MEDKTIYFEQQLSELEQAVKSPFKNYIRLLSFVIKNQTCLLIAYILCCIVQGGLTPIVTVLWKQYIDLSGTITAKIIVTLLLFIFIMILQSLFEVVLENIAAKFNFSSWFKLDKIIGNKAASIHAEYYELPAIQTVIGRAWYFTRAGFILLFQVGLTIFSSLSKTIGLLISLYWINPWLFMIGLLSVIPALIHKYLIAYEEALSKKQDSKEAIQYQYFKNVFFEKISLRELVLNNQFPFFNQKLRDSKEKIVKIRIKLCKKKISYQLCENMIRNILLMVCVIITVIQIINGKTSIGSFAAVFLLIQNLISSMQELVQHISNIISSSYSIQEFYRFLDLDEKPRQAIINDNLHGNSITDTGISFHNVSFRYPLAKEFALNNVTLEVKKGEHVAVVGANGSGKTTFAKLLMGLLLPSFGTVGYNGKDIETMEEKTYQTLFSPVFQDFNKYKDTLFYNIFIADITKKENTKEIRKSLELAGFDKQVEEEIVLSGAFGGIELSGGEWQKIAIARALFSDKEILILDEPTAAIDPVKESMMYQRFDEISQGKTTFFITHRLGSVLLADKILFFENGKVEECGSHEDLLKKDGKYAAFWKMQAGLYQI